MDNDHTDKGLQYRDKTGRSVREVADSLGYEKIMDFCDNKPNQEKERTGVSAMLRCNKPYFVDDSGVVHKNKAIFHYDTSADNVTSPKSTTSSPMSSPNSKGRVPGNMLDGH